VGVGAEATVNATRGILTQSVDLQFRERCPIAQVPVSILLVVFEQGLGAKE
jgi:hypothetical protein